MPNPITGAEVEELESLIELTGLRGWRVFKNLITKHKQYCIEQSNSHLRKAEYSKAGEWLARSDEPNALLTLVDRRKQELNKRREGK